MKKEQLTIALYLELSRRGFKDSEIAKKYGVSRQYVYKLKQQLSGLVVAKEKTKEKVDAEIINSIRAEKVAQELINKPDFDFDLDAKNFLKNLFRKKDWKDERAQVMLATMLMEFAKK